MAGSRVSFLHSHTNLVNSYEMILALPIVSVRCIMNGVTIYLQSQFILEKRVFDHCDIVSYHSRAVVMITVSIIVLLILFIGII